MCLGLRKVVLLISAFFLGYSAFAQDSSYVQWTVSSKKTGDAQYELQLKGKVQKGKILYLFTKDAEGLDSLSLKFTDSSIVKIGAVEIKTGSSSYTDPVFDNKNVLVAKEEVILTQKIRINGVVPAQLKGTIVYTTGGNEEFLPAQEFLFDVKMEGGVAQTARIKINSIDLNNTVSNCGDEGTEGKSLWGIFLLGLVGGFIALLTPCVFPLIPLTVSFFTKRSGSRAKGIRNALPAEYPFSFA